MQTINQFFGNNRIGAGSAAFVMDQTGYVKTVTFTEVGNNRNTILAGLVGLVIFETGRWFFCGQ